MTRRKRQDIHRPAAIRPEAYEYVAMEVVKVEGLGDAEFLAAERALIQAHMARTGGTYSGHEHGGNCMVCGNVLAHYTALFYHAESNAYVRAGRDCCEKLGMSGPDFNAFTAAAHDHLEARAGKRKAEAFLASVGLSAAWELYVGKRLTVAAVPATEVISPEQLAADAERWNNRTREEEEAAREPREEVTVCDIVAKLIRYGSISEPQEQLVRKLLARIPERARIAAERAAEREAASPAPTGRVTVQGELLKVETRDTDFGSVVKMLLKTSGGWLLWSTCPIAALPCARGDRMTLAVTVTPSPKDPKFAFGSRPTLRNIERVAAVGSLTLNEGPTS